MASIERINKNLKGSTLVETLVAFTVLLICVSIAAMTVTGLSRSQGKFDYLEAWITIQNVAAETNRNHDFSETEILCNHFLIRRTVEPSAFTADVFVLELKVVDPGNRVRLHYKSLILPGHEIHP